MRKSKKGAETGQRRFSDLMFSMVSSGMGATVWTAGRFLLVAPFTNDDDEDDEDDAESAAPGRDGQTDGQKDGEGEEHVSNNVVNVSCSALGKFFFFF